ncbi:Sigma1 receptor like protein [Gracilaria domingensis]|nr:Sigma1 receptor like protein [Gracilaria domingensis]
MGKVALAGMLVSVSLALYFRPPQPVFTPESMADIARTALSYSQSINGTIETTIDHVIKQLRDTYPKYILDNPPWLFNNAGGAMGSMLVLHVSLVEYVIIFGTPVGTSGHTGRFMADDWFTILQGEQWAASPGSLAKQVFKPGDQHLLPRWSCKHYLMKPDSWALEYARGNILSMLPFGFADSFSSTLDVVTAWKTVAVSARGVITQILTQMRA